MGLVHDLGWVHAPEPNDEADRTWSLCFPTIAHRTQHLHVVEHGSLGWPQWLAFRDHLRTTPSPRRTASSSSDWLDRSDALRGRPAWGVRPG